MLARSDLLCLLFFLMTECAAVPYRPVVTILFLLRHCTDVVLYRLFTSFHSFAYTVNLYLPLFTRAITPLHIQAGEAAYTAFFPTFSVAFLDFIVFILWLLLFNVLFTLC